MLAKRSRSLSKMSPLTLACIYYPQPPIYAEIKLLLQYSTCTNIIGQNKIIISRYVPDRSSVM